MTVETLIKKLQKCNPKAKVLITVGNDDNDSLSTSQFEIHHAEEDEYIELFVHEEKCSKQV